jgi:PAS domain S-box-containing protein
MHSLRIKLLLFTILFVFTTSMAILWVSVYQIRKKGERDIEDIRSRETARVFNSLKEHVNIIYSLIDAQFPRSLTQREMVSVFDKIKNLTFVEGRGYFWVSDTSDSPTFLIHPFFDSLNASDRKRVLELVSAVSRAVRIKNEDYLERIWPKFSKGILTDSTFSKLCYGRVFRPLGWIIASGRYIDDINDIIAERIIRSRQEISVIIRERIFLSAIILFLCTVAIVVFSRTITRPINKLVTLTEEITSGKKGYSERIATNSRDEIGRLAHSFNRMLGHIESTLEKLEENGRKYRELVENANSAIIRVDERGKILFVNEFAQRLLGFAQDEVLGLAMENLLKAPPDSNSPISIKDVLAEPNQHLYMEVEIITSVNERKWLAWSNRPLYDEQGFLREILCVGSDISARKKAEELAKIQQRKLIQTDKMATLGMLVSGVTHEINNPNNFIILNAESLSEMWNDIRPILDDFYTAHHDYTLGGLPYGEMREEFPALIRGTAEGAQRIKKIVQSLRDFIRQEPGDLDQSVNVAKVVETACLILGNMIKKSTDCFSVLQNDEIPFVKGNFQRLEQVIINLLTNACQATTDRSKPITVTISRESNSRNVQIVVRDQGIGIKQEHMKHIMNPFFTTKRDSGGSGLGLAIAYSIVKDHGGDLIIESAPDEGTRAIVTLPAG